MIHLNKKLLWFESGIFIIYPDSVLGLIWGVSKTTIIFISLFTFSF